MEVFRRYNSGGKSRFLVSLLKIYTNIALTGLSQVCAQPFNQFNVAFFAVGQQAENLPLNVPFLLYRRVSFELFIGHFATFLGHFQHRDGSNGSLTDLDSMFQRFTAQA